MLKQFILFSGSSHPELGAALSKGLGQPLGKVKKNYFPDGEIGIELGENVLCKETFILQSCVGTPDPFFMELLLMADALKRAGAREIGAILPYYPYSRQDRVSKIGEPISARVIAECLEAVGVSRVISFDLHQGQLEGFFNIPFLHLSVLPAFYDRIKNLNLKNLIVVAPDLGSVKIARKYAQNLGVEFVVIDKYRIENRMEMRLIGEVLGLDVLIVDDICSTATTLVKAAELCKQQGATRILAAVTHGIFANDALQRIESSPIEKLFVSDTIPNKQHSPKVEHVSIANLLSQGIKAVTG